MKRDMTFLLFKYSDIKQSLENIIQKTWCNINISAIWVTTHKDTIGDFYWRISVYFDDMEPQIYSLFRLSEYEYYNGLFDQTLSDRLGKLFIRNRIIIPWNIK